MMTAPVSHRDNAPHQTDQTDSPVESDSLVEEVSIDGMCGVY